MTKNKVVDLPQKKISTKHIEPSIENEVNSWITH